MPRDEPPEHRSWLLQRRHSLSQRQLAQLFAAICIPSLTLTGAFLWWGYWYMLAYALLEMTVVALCLRHHARHAADYDRIIISPNGITIEQRRARCRCHIRVPPLATRLLPPQRDSDPVRLIAAGANVKLGEFLPSAQRYQLARELSAYLDVIGPRHAGGAQR
ncbi:putative membrane protein [Duganella sp. 1224]|uniref:DUF2244 domain-containing protein n=1 Tax=Duganella sp. 1224 TaxID=2587052 RepID=UPI0015CE4A5E|nr:DUF2244 domain-containing protein [Duganella sp. 1224]NYE63653.1 putative membrane protein [Duganella sp. 1224]